MPTASEYAGLLPEPDQPEQQTPDCAALEPLFQQSPELRKSFGCFTPPPVQEVVQDCTAVEAAIREAVQADLAACQEICRLTAAECEACVRGALQRDKDRIEAIAAKCGDKIRSNLDNTIRDLVAAMNVIGIPPPTDEQLVAAAAGQPIPPPPPPIEPLTPQQIQDIAVKQAADIVNGMPSQPQIVTPIYTGPIMSLTGQPATFGDSGTTAPRPYLCPIGTLKAGMLVASPNDCGGPAPPPVILPGPTGPCTQAPSDAAMQAGFEPLTIITTESFNGQPPDPTGTPNDGGQWCIAAEWHDPVCPLHMKAAWLSSMAWMGQPVCPGNPPPPPPPPPPQPPPDTGTCPSCGAGYHWGTDSNGNPVCVKDCSCPPPPPPGPPTVPGGNGEEQPPEMPDAPAVPDFCDPDGCQALGGMFDNLSTDFSFSGFSDAFTARFGLDEGKSPLEIFNQIVSDPAGLIGSALAGVVTTVGEIINLIPSSPIPGTGTAGCNSPAYRIYGVANAMVGFLNYFGVMPAATVANYRYALNYICQWRLPTTNETTAAWSRGYLDDKQWECAVKANGDCLPWQKKLRDAAYTRIGIRDAYRLWKLEQLDSDQFQRGWKENGVDFQRDENLWKNAMVQYPSFPDLIRMMIRDVEDGEVVEKLGLDEDFEEKWTGTLKKWGESQGVSDDVARYHWRAHWQMYSPTQVFDWLHRLREDDRDPDAQFSDLKVTQDDARTLLKIADYAPGLVDNYIAVSYRPLNRVDIKRMYVVGVLKDKTAIRRAYRDLGYDAKNAERQADFVIKSQAGARAKFIGSMPESQILRLYVSGVLGKDQTVRLLVDAGVETDSIGQKLETADIQRHANYVLKVRTALQKRYFMGEFTQAEIRGELERSGTDPDFVDTISAQWEQERRARSKHIAVDKLCKMFERGLINMDEYMRRIRNLNYPEADALLLIENCVSGIKERQFAALVKEQERQKKELQQRARDAARLKRELAPCRVVKPVCRNGIGGQTTGK